MFELSVWWMVSHVPAVKLKSFACLYECKHKSTILSNIFLWCDSDENNQHLTSSTQAYSVFICQVVLILMSLNWMTHCNWVLPNYNVLCQRNLICCVEIFCFYFVWILTWSIKVWWHDKIYEWQSEWRWIIGGWIMAW